MNKTNCFLLVGVPGSGKSTLAKRLARSKNALVLSTDTIRTFLYGNPEIQGNWLDIERVLHRLLLKCVSQNKSVIVDATHTLRAHRKALLTLSKQINWTCIYLKTDLNLCHKRNLKRSRTVPKTVIDNMYQNTLQEPPTLSEGFTYIKTIEV
tara:strand:+ start:103 stop:558 length:456 start_codon:yes stop_codon:yes gene_type:complete